MPHYCILLVSSLDMFTPIAPMRLNHPDKTKFELSLSIFLYAFTRTFRRIGAKLAVVFCNVLSVKYL